MNTARILSLAGLLVGTLATLNSYAAPTDVGELTYQCRIDGISSACQSLPPSPPTPSHHLVPGSYGSYLVYLGVAPEKAIELAREQGDETMVRIVDTTPPDELTGYEAYLRYLGRDSWPATDLVASRGQSLAGR